ncbi:MAG: hypothetical protein JWM80_189 [Cyanobacteria bacterium RYN_339]|nr:hypothetical protein [Cyanobacteria bacterium RYN_339]
MAFDPNRPITPGKGYVPSRATPQQPSITPQVTATTPGMAGDRAKIGLDDPYAVDDPYGEMPKAPEDDGTTWGDYKDPHKPEFNFHHASVGGQLWTTDPNGDVVWADNGKRVAQGQVDLMPEAQRNAYFGLAGISPVPPRQPSAFLEPKPREGPGVQTGGVWGFKDDDYGYGSGKLGGDGEHPIPVGGESGLGVKMPVAYDPKHDTARFDWSTHEVVESSFARVARWADDLVKGGKMEPNEAFYHSIQRLRRDFLNTERDWRESGFADVQPLDK